MRRLVFAIALLGLAASIASAQDLLQVTSPKEYKVEVENDRVRVIRVKRPPHSVVPMHEHKLPFVVIYMKDDHAKVTTSEGKMVESTHKAGDFVFNQPVKHDELHLIDTPLEVILVELKGKPSSVTIPAALDPLKVDPKHHKVEFENDRVRIIRSSREGHSTVPMHQHPAYVNVVLTDLQTKMTFGDGKVSETNRKAGDVVYRAGVKHAVENLSDKTTVELQIELK